MSTPMFFNTDSAPVLSIKFLGETEGNYKRGSPAVQSTLAIET
jgi:hypothetical protein